MSRDRGDRRSSRNGARTVATDLPVQMGVTHWYDARQGLSASNWTPRVSGAAYAATQGTAGLQPTITTIGAGTHPAALFDGVDDVLSLAGSKWLLGNDATFSVVGYVQSNSVGTKGFMNAGIAGASAFTTFITIGQASSNLYFGHRTDNSSATAIGASPICQGASFTNATLTSQLYLNGAANSAPVVHTAVTAGAVDTCRIGGLTLFGAPAWSGKIAHLLVFEGVALTTPQHAALSAYLAGVCA